MTNDECQMDRSRRSLSGFSTTEVIVVVVLIGVLLYLVTPRFSSGGGKTHIATVHSDIKGGLKTALDRYQVEIGSYPKNLQDLVTRPNDTKNWGGPYLDEVPKDPWGHPYVYIFPGRYNTNGYDLYSMGPDGKAETADDIGNWVKQ